MTQNTDFQKRIARAGTLSVTVPNGHTKSEIFDTQGAQLFGIEIPAAFTACSLTFLKASLDGVGTLLTVNDLNQSAYTIPVTQGNYFPIDQTVFAGVDRFLIVCSVSQGADRILRLVQAPLFAT